MVVVVGGGEVMIFLLFGRKPWRQTQRMGARNTGIRGQRKEEEQYSACYK